MDDTPIPDDVWEAARSLRNAVNWNSNSSVEIIARALMARDERAARIADAYADENIAMASDTIMIDPILNGKRGQVHTEEEWKRANDLMIEGCIHSSMFHAAKNIAAAIRSGG